MKCQLESLIESARSEYSVTSESVEICGVSFDFVRPSDPDALLDDEVLLQSHDELPWQPYWAQAWEAANGMMAFLLEQDLAGKSVLDVGCGLGLTAAAALHQGADVVLGDNAPPALLFAEINTWHWRDRANIIHLDWNTTRLEQPFDWIIGSDILYDRRDVQPLNEFFRHHLSSNGQLFLSDPSRAMTGDFLKEFEQLGWSYEATTRKVDGQRDVRIIELRLN